MKQSLVPICSLGLHECCHGLSNPHGHPARLGSVTSITSVDYAVKTWPLTFRTDPQSAYCVRVGVFLFPTDSLRPCRLLAEPTQEIFKRGAYGYDLAPHLDAIQGGLQKVCSIGCSQITPKYEYL